MSADFDNDDNKYLSATTLNISSNDSVLLAGWYKYDSTYSKGSVAVLGQLRDGTGHPSIRWSHDSGAKGATFVDGTYRTQTSDTFSDDTWFLWGIKYGPWDNTANPAEYWLNANHSQTNVTRNSPGLTIDSVFIGRWEQAASGGAHGLITKVGIWVGYSEAQTDTIMSDLLTTEPDAISDAPDYYWPLGSDANATIGGVNLTNNGTVTFDADEPTLGGGGGGTSRAQIIIC